jgi:hypothetical protein
MDLFLKSKHNDEWLKSKAGTFFTLDKDWLYIDPCDTTRIYDIDTSNVIAIIHKNAFDESLCTLAVTQFMNIAKKYPSTNRGMAAGTINRYHINNRFEKSDNVHSSIVGYFDSTNGKLPCRLTKITKDHFDKYTNGLPFIHRMNECFYQNYPEAYQRQYRVASNSGYNIPHTAFSTLTINYNFRTALHIDKGDYKDGFGNLTVCSKDIQGGELLFPKYELAIHVKTGDFIAMDVHQYHCNNEIKYTTPESYRLSFVGYFRASLMKCRETNKRHDSVPNRDTNFLIHEIFHMIGEDVPDKKSLGISNKGLEWWERQSKRFRLVYKGKQYILYDLKDNTKIMSLIPAYLYVKNLVVTANF